MQDAIYEAITDAQKAEALEACTAVLSRWSELQPLTGPLERKRREIVARYEKAATHTDQSKDSRQKYAPERGNTSARARGQFTPCPPHRERTNEHG